MTIQIQNNPPINNKDTKENTSCVPNKVVMFRLETNDCSPIIRVVGLGSSWHAFRTKKI